jgi:hypothetical protein
MTYRILITDDVSEQGLTYPEEAEDVTSVDNDIPDRVIDTIQNLELVMKANKVRLLASVSFAYLWASRILRTGKLAYFEFPVKLE